mmetsp:Transcript_17279/g.21246  ORF Transcript_17279/g.21246 Transcript_17279/m.21246 type:complete len:193 (-) Transcript_17279:19-597(-)
MNFIYNSFKIMGSVFGKISEEMPSYKSIKKTTNYELRLYDERFAIEIRHKNFKSENNAFFNLAGYIGVVSKPENKANESISMTAPVVTCESSDDYVMQFVLPSKYDDITKIPKPNNNDIQIIKRPSKLFAVKVFNGWATEDDVNKLKNTFIKELRNDNINLVEPINWELYRYNAPYTIPYFRTNEIAIEVEQ